MTLSEKLKDENSKIKVGVMMGGPSSEREISLESGRHIYNSLDDSKYEKIPIFVSTDLKFWIINEALLWMNTTEDIQGELENQGAQNLTYQELPDHIEIAFLGLHGKFVEDGALQGLLEFLGIPYNGPGIIGAAIGMDKYYQRKVLKGAGLNVPKHMPVIQEDYEDDPETIIKTIEGEFNYPMIVKPSREGCSTAVAKVKDQKELRKAIDEALNWDILILIEEFIDAQEITCTIIGNDNPEALTPTETPKKGDFLTVEEKFLPGDASMITPPTGMDEGTVEKVKAEFVKAYKAMELSVYSRIDAFWKDGKLIILEPNTLPGVTPSTMVFHQAAEAGMGPGDFFDRIIELSIEAFEKKVGPR
ncbi:D-alanine--D-alanine ligase [Candidatus Dojkabacteria bacterium]|nr:D-alanine--D-alanine ligase [Candidatus Dojkabacteria bacterium]